MASWARTVDAYLADRSTLRRVCLLLDARRGPTDNDREACEHLDVIGMTYQLVLTKADKVKKTELEAVTAKIEAKLKKNPAAHPIPRVTSAEKGYGIPELRAEVGQLVES